jgi:hypothetical protein
MWETHILSAGWNYTFLFQETISSYVMFFKVIITPNHKNCFWNRVCFGKTCWLQKSIWTTKIRESHRSGKHVPQMLRASSVMQPEVPSPVPHHGNLYYTVRETFQPLQICRFCLPRAHVTWEGKPILVWGLLYQMPRCNRLFDLC